MKALTRKVGPLPVWAYAVIIGGAFLAMRMLRGNKSESGDATVQLIPTGAPSIDPSSGFLNELSMRLDRIETVTTNPPPASSNGESINLLKMLLDRLSAVGGAIQPVGNGGPAATYNAEKGAWTVHDWKRLTPDRIVDIVFAHSAGFGPRTETERDVYSSYVTRATELMQTYTPEQIHNILSPEVAQYRQYLNTSIPISAKPT